ncbi:lytic transglycosylase domain-containing protein [Paracoccus aminophilus]|uniref:Transglycosylase, SLT domain protein n=1 Tax=Paracoccus aminophilus JCM 7686 TaxID=1367847 RepID=S5XWJ5_PARAH|nr:lytic transglycosylase domain-containing protein [Paracoccus aminophilus]AGT09657.1 transglycosylase, SLT domain protein [Paracoccus aminophilus JCM 7686]
MIARRSLIFSVLALAACGSTGSKGPKPRSYTGGPHPSPEMNAKVNYWADHYNVPRPLVHRVVIRESKYRPEARNGPYFGLMQIQPQTARTMGYRGDPQGLLDADTNLQYGVKYLRGAYLVANGNHDSAVSWYSRGYYYEAKRRGLLEATGLKASRV